MVRISCRNFQLFLFILYPSWPKYAIFCLPWFFFLLLIKHVRWNFFDSCFDSKIIKNVLIKNTLILIIRVCVLPTVNYVVMQTVTNSGNLSFLIQKRCRSSLNSVATCNIYKTGTRTFSLLIVFSLWILEIAKLHFHNECTLWKNYPQAY